MAFLISTDYDSQIKSGELSILTDGVAGTLAIAEGKAIAEMRGYLNARYDTNAVFAATGNDRAQDVVMFLVDMTLYHLYTVLNQRNIPKFRTDRYNEAKQWCRDVCDCLINPDLPVPDNESKSYVQSTSRTKRTNGF